MALLYVYSQFYLKMVHLEVTVHLVSSFKHYKYAYNNITSAVVKNEVMDVLASIYVL